MRVERLTELSRERKDAILKRAGEQIFAPELIREIEALVEDVRREGRSGHLPLHEEVRRR